VGTAGLLFQTGDFVWTIPFQTATPDNGNGDERHGRVYSLAGRPEHSVMQA
jgi:hypothetical protein